MKESGYYPPGAEFDPNAPYNEPVIPEKEFSVTISQTFSKDVTVTTNDYAPEVEDDGSISTNTENTDWREVYENHHFKIQDLLTELSNYITEDLKSASPNTGKYIHLKRLLEACNGWVEDEYEVIEN